MRLALKLTLALVAGMIVVLVVQATVHVRRVARVQEEAARDELSGVGSTLARATADLWIVAGEARARAFVAEANDRRQSFAIALWASDAPLAAPHREGDVLVTAVPIVAAGEVVAVLELRRALEGERAYVREVVLSQLGTTAALALLSGLIALVLGGWLIARPVARLIDQARRVAQGDYETKVELHQRDELGRLADELGAMTAELAKSRGQLGEQRRARAALQEQLRHADRLSTVGELASGIAHELGTPLNVVSGRAQLIQAQAGASAEVSENARIIADQARRMTAIIRQLLDFARRHRPARQRADVHEVVAQAVTLLEPIAEAAGVSLETRTSPGTLALIDVAKTLQVLTNLMVNAVQAMPGGGTVVVSAREEEVGAPPDDHAEPGAYVVLSVKDEGVGIASEDLEQVFEPFFTTKRPGRGTGLGLYVCHGIVREQSGYITVHSEVGKGSRFDVYLPRDAEEPTDG